MTVKPKIEITPEKAIALLEECVAEKGAAFIYERPQGNACAFVDKGVPSCLVGHALHKAGITLAALRRFDKVGGNIECLVNDGSIALPEVATSIFQRAQELQDDGWTWGKALNEAKVVAAQATA